LLASGIVIIAVHANSNGTQKAAAAQASPLLWGANIALDVGTLNSDSFLSNPKVRQGLKDIGTQIIRFPVRGTPNQPTIPGIKNWPEVQQAAMYVKQLSMTPLVILRNPRDSDLLNDDTQVVQYMTQLFGSNSTVYYEWGNEPDLNNGNQVDVNTDVNQWNNVVSKLKTMAPKAQFIGPVGFEYGDGSYIKTFLQNAQPTPDEVSWHSYTCNAGDSEDTCLQRLDKWNSYYNDIRSWMSSHLNKQLPIWITEWNYNPSQDIHTDFKLKDQAFLQSWTQKAMQTFIDNGIGAAMYFDTEQVVPLVDANGTPTTQGIVFQNLHNQYASGNMLGTTPGATSTPTQGNTSCSTTATATGTPTTATGTVTPTDTATATGTPTTATGTVTPTTTNTPTATSTPNAQLVVNLADQALSITTRPGATVKETLMLKNGGTQPLTWSASIGGPNMGNWLAISATCSTLQAGESVNLDITITTQGLTAGTYTGQVQIISNGGSQVLSINLVISCASSTIDNCTPTQIPGTETPTASPDTGTPMPTTTPTDGGSDDAFRLGCDKDFCTSF
jgi:hypothetical protein